MSNHLACLRWCRFVEAERRGRQIRTLLARARALAEPNCDHLTLCTRIGPNWI